MEKWLIPGIKVRNAHEPGAASCAKVRQGSKSRPSPGHRIHGQEAPSTVRTT